MIHLALVVPSIITSSIAAFIAGQWAEKTLHRDFHISAQRAEKFILKFLADGKEHATNEIYLNASADGHAFLALQVAHGNLGDAPRGNGKVKTIWHERDQYLRLA